MISGVYVTTFSESANQKRVGVEGYVGVLSLRARAGHLIQGSGLAAARAGVNRGIIARHAPPNCGSIVKATGQQLQTGLELPTNNNGAAVLLLQNKHLLH